MAKIIVYGGCHAQILRDYLISAFDTSELDVDLLINFELIKSNQPFPYEMVDRCDAVIYSPVENKGQYNTNHLEDYCREHGKLALCYPWIEWHGYCPGAVKGLFKTRFQWYYPELLSIARGFDDFPSFYDHVVERFPSDDTIDRVFVQSSERLIAAEQRHGMSVRLGDFIQAHHRDSRLFLISDHPSRRVYVHVLRQILDQLGLAPRSAFPEGEPQWQCRTPILPRVATRLRLGFDDTEWADDVLAPARRSTLEDYLSLYFHGDGVVLAPRQHAELVTQPKSTSITLPLDSASRVLASPIARDEFTGIDHFKYLATLAGPPIALDPMTRFSIESKLWRKTWES